MELKEVKEIIINSLAWGDWTEEQKRAMIVAYKSIHAVECIKDFCENCRELESTIQPFEILDLIK